MRNCPSVETLYFFLEAELGQPERLRLEAHLEGCPACREALAEKRVLHEAFTSLPPIVLPPDFAMSVMERIPEAVEAKARWLAPLVAGTASLVVGLFGFYLLTGESLADVLVSVNRVFGSAVGHFLPLFAKLFKVGGLLMKISADLVALLVKALEAFSHSLGAEVVGLILGLGLVLSLLLFFGAKRLLSLGEKT